MARAWLAALALIFAGAGHSAAAQQAEPDGALRAAIFAGGCFWCTESDFEKVPGVVEAVSGYSGGRTESPSYRDVTAGGTGHYEAVRVTYDPAVVTYDTLVEFFWRTIDPTDAGGQFCDRGESYRTAIFVDGAIEQAAAQASRAALVASGRLEAVETEILPRAEFFEAEAYHQDYAKRNVLQYGAYRAGCGRDRRLKRLWGDEAGGQSILQAAGLIAPDS